jgi:hypothetical protein
MILQTIGEPVIRAAWGISEEQHQLMGNHVVASLEDMSANMPAPFVSRIQTQEETGRGVGFSIHTTHSNVTAEEVIAVSEKVAASMMDARTSALHEYLTPEQWQRINESQLAIMGEIPFIPLCAFGALGLTDEQRQEMERVKKELDPEFEKTLKNWVNGTISLISTQGVEDPEFKRIFTEIRNQGQAFVTQLRTRMFDVLTDEQWFRLQDLVDNPPEHVLAFRRALRELRGESDEVEETESAESADVWVPGPNAWRPGMAIPDEYRIQRNERRRLFPRGEE